MGVQAVWLQNAVVKLQVGCWLTGAQCKRSSRVSFDGGPQHIGGERPSQL